MEFYSNLKISKKQHFLFEIKHFKEILLLTLSALVGNLQDLEN